MERKKAIPTWDRAKTKNPKMYIDGAFNVKYRTPEKTKNRLKTE